MNTTEYQAFVINPSASKGVGLIQLKEYRKKWDNEVTLGHIERTSPKNTVSSLGIQFRDGMKHTFAWVVTGNRAHGYVGEIEPMSRNSKELFEAMFKGWN